MPPQHACLAFGLTNRGGPALETLPPIIGGSFKMFTSQTRGMTLSSLRDQYLESTRRILSDPWLKKPESMPQLTPVSHDRLLADGFALVMVAALGAFFRMCVSPQDGSVLLFGLSVFTYPFSIIAGALCGYAVLLLFGSKRTFDEYLAVLHLEMPLILASTAASTLPLPTPIAAVGLLLSIAVTRRLLVLCEVAHQKAYWAVCAVVGLVGLAAAAQLYLALGAARQALPGGY